MAKNNLYHPVYYARNVSVIVFKKSKGVEILTLCNSDSIRLKCDDHLKYKVSRDTISTKYCFVILSAESMFSIIFFFFIILKLE